MDDSRDILDDLDDLSNDGNEQWKDDINEDLDVPEISRLHDFIKSLEEELNETNNSFKSRSNRKSKYDDDSEEEIDPFTKLTLEDSYKMLSPSNEVISSPNSAIDQSATPKRSNLDEYLEALQIAGYRSVSSQSNSKPNPFSRSSSRNQPFDSFFSALHDHDSPYMQSPHLRNQHYHNLKDALSPISYDQNQPTLLSKRISSSKMLLEEISAESLRRNWEMEDDEDDDEGQPSPDKTNSPPRKSSLLPTPEHSQAIISPKKNILTIGSVSLDEHEVSIVEVTGDDNDESFYTNTSLSDKLTKSLDSSFLDIPIIDADTSNLDGDEEDGDDVNHSRISRRHQNANMSIDDIETEENKRDKKDVRLHGDFCVWSAGEKLSSTYLFNEYIGLYTTTITHFNDAGKLVIANPITSNTTSSGSELNKSTHKFSSGDFTATTSTTNIDTNNNRGYYNVHVMECVLRPDIEIKSVMSLVYNLARLTKCKCSMLQRSHTILTPTKTARNSFAGFLSSNHAKDGLLSDIGETANLEWDQIDVQVCISKELRQRVLMLQFAKKVSVFNDGRIGSMIFNQINGPVEFYPLKNCPLTYRMITHLKREIIKHDYSLSALYNVTLKEVCALPKGLDSHFLAQLHSLCRDQMWIKLTTDYHEMEKYLEDQESEANLFIGALESMFKLYGIKPPDLWNREITLNAIAKGDLDDENNDHNRNHDYLLDDATPISPIIAHITNNASNTIQSPEKTLPSPLEKLPSQSDTPVSSTVTPQKVLLRTYSTPTAFTPSPERNSYIKDLLNATKVDGMTFCLVMLDKCYQEYQNRCDDEYTTRVQQRHALSLRLIQEIIKYKKFILESLVHSPEVKVASFSKTFYQLFLNNPIYSPETEIPPTPILDRTSSAISSSEEAKPSETQTAPTGDTKKSWLKGIGLTSSASTASQPNAVPTNQNTTTNKTNKNGFFSGLLFGGDSPQKGKPTTTKSTTTSASTTTRGPQKTSTTENKPHTNSTITKGKVEVKVSKPPPLNTMNKNVSKSNLSHVKSSPSAVFGTHSAIASSASSSSSSSTTTSPNTRPRKNSKPITPVNKEISPKETNKEPSTPPRANPTPAAVNISTITQPPPKPNDVLSTPPRPSHPATVSQTLDGEVVIYYCACLISNIPGTLYITQHYICFIRSVVGLNQRKEIYPLKELNEILTPETDQSTTKLPSKSIKLLFFANHNNHKDVVISPMVIDIKRLRAIILEIRTVFC